MEQRFWLAFLYSTTYCGATAYFMYNEFPDFENVDRGRLERWWAKDKDKLLFQTDRKWIHSRNQWVDSVMSYTEVVGPHTQAERFNALRGANDMDTYRNAYAHFSRVYQFGRFSMFNYLEAVHVVTGFEMEPDTLPLRESDSSRNGLAFAMGMEALVNHFDGHALSAEDYERLTDGFNALRSRLGDSVWSLETTLCAFKKYRLGKRYVGYYVDRQGREIAEMEMRVRDGVDWTVLWDFRREHFVNQPLIEGHFSRNGLVDKRAVFEKEMRRRNAFAASARGVKR